MYPGCSFYVDFIMYIVKSVSFKGFIFDNIAKY